MKRERVVGEEAREDNNDSMVAGEDIHVYPNTDIAFIGGIIYIL